MKIKRKERKDMKKLLFLFGGESNEYEVSNISAYNVISQTDTEKYDITKIGITKDGRWYLADCDLEDIKSGEWVNKVKYEAVISPSKNHRGIVIFKENETIFREIDVCFPVLHGANGEDGTIQALLKLAGIKRVGPDFLSCAMAMDKKVSKIIFENAGIPVVPAVYTYSPDDCEKVWEKMGVPVFVKPANSGSSVGCYRVNKKEELKNAIEKALLIDKCVLVEKFIDCREIECGILGNEDIFVSDPGEILADCEFYDYDTKYNSPSKVNIKIPADITEEQKTKIKEYAKKAYVSLGLSGMTRADFFIDRKNGDIYLNEVNTIPGFTSLSMYPMLLMNSGYTYSELIDKLIDLAQ